MQEVEFETYEINGSLYKLTDKASEVFVSYKTDDRKSVDDVQVFENKSLAIDDLYSDLVAHDEFELTDYGAKSKNGDTFYKDVDHVINVDGHIHEVRSVRYLFKRMDFQPNIVSDCIIYGALEEK